MKRIFTLLLVLASLSVVGQEMGVLSGKISDTNVEPIPGATVRLLNTNIGTTTDDAGEFSIPDLVKAKYTLEISAVGYASIKRKHQWRAPPLSNNSDLNCR